MECCGTAILPLQFAAEEAWMSITRLQADHGPLAVPAEAEWTRLGRGG